MNTGTVRILIIVALGVAGVAVLANGFGGGGGAVAGPASPPPTTTVTPKPSTTKTPQPTSTPSPQVNGVPVMVFNGTIVTGLGAQVQELLVKDGYVFPADATDAPHKPQNVSIVYFRGGADAAQNESDAHYVAKTYMNGAKVKELSPDFESLVDKSVAVVVVVGVDFTAAP